MTVLIRTEAPPIRKDGDGALRVGNSRVLLELVVEEFLDGATPEAIVQQYPTLALSDAYAVIGYYLHHREEIDAYREQRDQSGQKIRQQIEALQGDLGDIRQRLLVRSRP